MTKRLSLLLVDDHRIVRAGLRMLFQAEPDMVIAGEVGSGDAAIQAVRQVQPDVIIMDVAMPGMSGIEATRQIKEISPGAAVLALTMHEDEEYFFAMLDAGASGYIPNVLHPTTWSPQCAVVAQGHVFLHSSLAKHLIKDMVERNHESGGPSILTPRELEVLTYIAEGYTSREIAETLVISSKTVDRHRENIMAKLDMHNRVELVKYAIEKGLISTG